MGRQFRRQFRHALAGLSILFCATLFVSNLGGAAQEASDSRAGAVRKPALTAEEIVRRLEENNAERLAALRKFQSTRLYRVQYRGFFGTRQAEAVVRFNYAFPDGREFQVVSQTGSKFILEHVIKGLIEGEKESATEENRRRTALNARNYNFTLAVAETAREPSQYVLDLSPKNDNKFLYRGRIWVDANDFAVTRIEGEPAKSPSFWVKHSDVHHRYEKIDGFWLPAENKTESWIRMGGHALLSIEYTDYKIMDAAPIEREARADAQSDAPAAGHQDR